jgi:hypothetical protein
MIKTLFTVGLICSFILLYVGFRKLDRKLEALVRLNKRKYKK